MKIIVLSVLTDMLVGTKLLIWHNVTCVEQLEFTDCVLCFVLCREGFGVDSGLRVRPL